MKTKNNIALCILIGFSSYLIVSLIIEALIHFGPLPNQHDYIFFKVLIPIMFSHLMEKKIITPEAARNSPEKKKRPTSFFFIGIIGAFLFQYLYARI